MNTAISVPPPFVWPRRTDALVRIAVLDNHWAVRAGLKTVIDLEPDMVFVGSAAGEEELRWLLRRTDPSMLVLDVNHPGRDGLALTLRLKRRVNPPRIVLYSGRGDGPLISAAALVAGVDALVRKTATQRELLEAIRTAAESRPALTMTPAGLRQAATRIAVHDHAILALRAARTSWGEIASTLGLGDRALAERAAVIVSRLSMPESPGGSLAAA